MKPHRLQMTHNLVLAYGLYKKMQCFRPHLATDEELVQFHAEDYVDFIRRVTPDNSTDFAKQLQKFTVGEDCPVFDGLYDYCRVYTGGSLDGAMKLNHGHANQDVKWAALSTTRSGRRRAASATSTTSCSRSSSSSSTTRVLYLDIDIHHGDGVEEATRPSA